MSIRTRFILGAAIVALPLIFLAIGLSLAVQKTAGSLQASVQQVNVEVRRLIRLQQDGLQAALALRDALERQTPASRDRFAQIARALDGGFDEALAAPLALAPARDLVRAARDHWQEARASAERLLAGTPPPGSAAAEAEARRFRAHLDGAIQALEQAADLARREMDRQLELVRDVRRDTAALMILVLGVGPGVLLVVGGYVDRTLLNPLRALQEAARRFGEGDLSSRVQVGAADEIGQLAETFNAMAEKIERDIRTRQRFEEQLQYLADHDALTGLYNRRRFQHEVEAHLARATAQTEAAVLFLDLDDFKDVNDTLGHRAGDEVLAGIGRLLRAGVRATDIPARVGGDEFAVFLPNTGPAEAQAVAQRLIDFVRRRHFRVGGRDLVMTASIGIALYPEHGTTTEELLTRADLAMYQSKNCGNSFCVYVPGRDGGRTASWLRCEAQLREALEKDRFVLFCQPILDLRRGRVDRYELLLRMKGEGDRLVGPETFLPVAERSGLIHDIDRWVVRHAIRLLARSPAALPDLCLEVNLSGKSFTDGRLPGIVEAELDAAGVEPGRLVFEITETALIPDLRQATDVVRSLRRLGCQFALDDFGRGFSSLLHLKQLPVDYLKIDGAFVEHLPRHPVDRHLVRAIVEAARGVGARTIAEYVRDEETLAILRELDVDYAQGYHVGPPVPAEQVLSFVSV